MYRLVAKMRRLISESRANSSPNSSSSPPASKHSAIEPRHSDLIGAKPSWKWSPPPLKSTALVELMLSARWTARIARKKLHSFEVPILEGELPFPSVSVFWENGKEIEGHVWERLLLLYIYKVYKWQLGYEMTLDLRFIYKDCHLTLKYEVWTSFAFSLLDI